jgi:hypothetical protein
LVAEDSFADRPDYVSRWQNTDSKSRIDRGEWLATVKNGPNNKECLRVNERWAEPAEHGGSEQIKDCKKKAARQTHNAIVTGS